MSQEFSFVKNSVNCPSQERTLLIMTYELGKVVQHFIYADMYGDVSSTMLHFSEMKMELGDLVSMMRMFCELCGFDFNEVMNIGEEHYLERMNDLRSHGRKY